MNNLDDQTHCECLRMRIAPERIHFMKSILEGYDGLALLTTIDRHDGTVELRFTPERKKDLTNLLTELHPLLAANTSCYHD